MIIETFPSGPFSTNAYVIGCSKTHQAAIVDPGVGSAEMIVQSLAQHNLQPSVLLLTHSHWDHIAEVAPLKKRYSLPVYIHTEDVPNLQQPGADLLPCWVPIEGVVPDHLLEEGQTLTIGELTFTVIHTPGHTPGGVCFWFKEQNVLFAGDTLFQGTIGNLSFPTCVPDKMWPSLAKLALLPPATKVYPGHGAPTTIAAEMNMLKNAKALFAQDY